MIVKLLIWPTIIILLILIYFNKDKTKSRRNIFILIVVLLFVIFPVFSVLIGFVKGRPQHEPVQISPDDIPKTIYFFNQTNQTINVIVDFKFSKDEILKQSEVDVYFNKIDTIHNLRNGENKYRQTSILCGDSIMKFPKSFNIKITDSLGKILKKYNKKEFLNSVEKSKYTNSHDIECKEKRWFLILK
jgi:hypothetical protein